MIAAETTLADGMEAVQELRPSLVMVDRAFGAPVVMNWLSAVGIEGFPPRVIVWGAAISEGEALRYLRAGARGIVLKTSSLNSILSCLRTVASGGTWTDDSMVREFERSRSNGHSPLTLREIQVMELVERGLKNKDIGDALGIRAGTVKIHLKHIFEKTGIRGRYGLALSGLKEKGLLTVADKAG